MRSIHELSDLTGRVCLLAGAAGHVGLAAAEVLAELGAAIVLCDRDRTTCEERAAAFPRAQALECDLADEAATRSAVREAADAFGRLDVLVHCAALVGSSELEGWAVPFERQSVEAFEAALRVNLTSAFVLAQEAAPHLRASGHGSIILFSSIYGRVGPVPELYEGTEMGNPAGYGASKAGLEQLMRHLAVELAPEVRVNAIAAGGIERGQPSVFQERYRARTPLGRMAREEDLKGAVAYLAGDLSSYVTGQVLVVDGGWTAW